MSNVPELKSKRLVRASVASTVVMLCLAVGGLELRREVLRRSLQAPEPHPSPDTRWSKRPVFFQESVPGNVNACLVPRPTSISELVACAASTEVSGNAIDPYGYGYLELPGFRDEFDSPRECLHTAFGLMRVGQDIRIAASFDRILSFTGDYLKIVRHGARLATYCVEQAPEFRTVVIDGLGLLEQEAPRGAELLWALRERRRQEALALISRSPWLQKNPLQVAGGYAAQFRARAAYQRLGHGFPTARHVSASRPMLIDELTGNEKAYFGTELDQVNVLRAARLLLDPSRTEAAAVTAEPMKLSVEERSGCVTFSSLSAYGGSRRVCGPIAP